MSAKQFSKEDLMNMSKEEIVALTLNLSSIIQTQNEEIANLKELYKLKTAEKYVPSSEQMGWLFEELEILDAVLATEVVEETTKVAEHNRKVRKRVNACSAPADTPVCDVFHTEGAKDSISDEDGIIYKRVEDKVINKIAIIPRKVVVERHHYPQYRSIEVENDGNNKKILFPNKVSTLGCSASLVANVVVSKFDDHLPLYRQEEIFRREGFFLSRQKLASWVILYYQELLPFAEYFRKKVYQSAYLSKDETRISVLDVKNPKGKISKNGYMYITVGDTYDPTSGRTRTLVLLDYIQGRPREVLFEDIGRYGYNGYLMTDGLKGYLSYDKNKHCVCWVHASRQFKAILKINKKNIHAAQIVKEAAKLFEIDKRYRKQLTSGSIGVDQFLSLRKEESNFVIDTIYTILEKVRSFYSPNGAMGKAIKYLDEYKAYLRSYLDVVEAVPSNNSCEIVAKAFATGRKNWLFSQTVDGADASAFFYSIIETAKRANINPWDYVEAVCTFGPGTRTKVEWDALLPDKVDLSRLQQLRTNRLEAKSDPQREKPYHFVGANR